MALRTRSGSARAKISAARIRQSETNRLQSAINDMEKAISDYDKDKGSRSKKKSLWSALDKLGKFATKIGAYTGNPILGGAGLAVSGVSGYARGSLSKKQTEKAKDIRTDFTDPLSNLLFVGQTAKEDAKGAESYKTGEEQATQEEYIGDLINIGFGLATQGVQAGQAGTFKEGGKIQEFLNKPLLDLGDAPGKDATSMDKYLYSLRQQSTPSVGQLLGGVSPQQQAMGQKFVDWREGKRISAANQKGFDALTNLQTADPADLGYDMGERIDPASYMKENIDMPSYEELSPGVGTSNVYPRFDSIVPSGENIIPAANYDRNFRRTNYHMPMSPYDFRGTETQNRLPQSYDLFDLIRGTVGGGNVLPSGVNFPTYRAQNTSDAFSNLQATINRYNQG